MDAERLSWAGLRRVSLRPLMFVCVFHPCAQRRLLRPVRHLLRVLRHPRLLPGDGDGPVHQRRRHHLLEESLPAVRG